MHRLTPLLIAAALFFSACGGSAASDPEIVTSSDDTTTDRAEPEPSLPETSASREVAETEDAEDAAPELDPEAIVAATVLIASGGDLEAAIAAGIISETEAEAALAVLEGGSVDDFLD